MKYWITWTSTPESLDMGGAPPHTDNRIRQAARGQGKVGLLKTTRQSQNALALESLNSLELLEATLPAFATAPSNVRQSAGRSPRSQPSEEV